jgi:hypothetical protein
VQQQCRSPAHPISCILSHPHASFRSLSEREWDLPMRGVARTDSAHLPGVVPPPLARARGICGQMWHHGGACFPPNDDDRRRRLPFLQSKPPLELISAAEAQGPCPVLATHTHTHAQWRLEKSDLDRYFLKSEPHDCRGKIEHSALRSDEQDFSFSLLPSFLTSTSIAASQSPTSRWKANKPSSGFKKTFL